MHQIATVEDESLLTQELLDIETLDVTFEANRLKDSLYEFVKAAWPILEPQTAFVDNWHISVICQCLQDITFGRTDADRWIFNIPPGTLKSILIGVMWPAWVWAQKPSARFLTASYGQHLSIRDNLRVRDIVMSEWYQRHFQLTLVEDQNTKTRYNTDANGWRIATSVGGVGTGEHPNYLIIDDPLTAAQAESEPERKAANDWFDRTISSRGITSRIVVIVVMQRLHEDDLTGHLLKRGGVEHVCFPMEYVPTRAAKDGDRGWTADPRDPRTKEGELLCPQLIPPAKVKKLKLDLDEYGTSGQLQQSPSPMGGGLFKLEWFKYFDIPPKIARRVRGWDTAATEGDGDWTVGVKIAEEFDHFPHPTDPARQVLKSTGRFFIEDVVRGQLGPDAVDKLMRSTAELDGREVAQREEQEGGASGKGTVAAHLKLLAGFDYKGVNLGQNKVIRAKPLRAQAEGGNIYLLRGAPWLQEYVRELCNFPAGEHDDQVDGSSCAFNSVLLEPAPRKVSPVWR